MAGLHGIWYFSPECMAAGRFFGTALRTWVRTHISSISIHSICHLALLWLPLSPLSSGLLPLNLLTDELALNQKQLGHYLQALSHLI